MTQKYTKKFDLVLAIPLALYVVLIIGLILSAFLKITPEAALSVFKNSAIWDSAARSFVTSLISTGLSRLCCSCRIHSFSPKILGKKFLRFSFRFTNCYATVGYRSLYSSFFFRHKYRTFSR